MVHSDVIGRAPVRGVLDVIPRGPPRCENTSNVNGWTVFLNNYEKQNIFLGLGTIKRKNVNALLENNSVKYATFMAMGIHLE